MEIAAQAAPALTTVTSDSRGGDTVRIELGQSASEGSSSFFVRQEGGDSPVTVSLRANLSRISGTVTFDPAEVTVPPSPGVADVTVSVTGIDQGGVFYGVLLARTSSGSIEIGRVQVSRAAALEIDGAVEGKYQVTHSIPDFTRAIRVVSRTNSVARGVTLRFGEFVGPPPESSIPSVSLDGQPYTGAAFTVPASGSRTFLVSASLTASGVHASRITIVHGGVEIPVDLEVTRTNATPTVTIDDLPSLQVERTFWLGAASAELQISLYETGGRRLTLRGPQLVSATRREGDHNTALTPPPGLAVGTDGWSGLIELDGYESKVVPVTLMPLNDPGQITATVRFSDGLGGVIDKELTAFVRDHWLRAALLIFLGVLASYGLRQWLSKRQPQLIHRYQIASIAEELRRLAAGLPEPAPEGARDLIEVMRDHTRRIYELVSRPVDADVATLVTELRAEVLILRRWIRAAARAEALGVRDKHDASLNAVARVLVMPDSKQADLDGAETQLTAVETALDAATAEMSLASAMDAEPPRELPEDKLPTPEDIERQLQREGRLVTAALAVIAVIIGMNLLWANELAWGGWADYMVAVLWGLGVHQVGDVSFNGTSGLREQFKRTNS